MKRELIEACRAGDREAQERLILKVQDQVYYQCRKMLKNEDDALDATQDVLLSMLNGLEGLENPGAFRSWLNRITVNVCCKHLRDNREYPLPDSGTPEIYWDFDDQMIPEKVLDTEENRRLIVELVDALPEAQRLCVLSYYFNEMSIREIAAAMETAESTVKSRLYYARKAIKEGVDRYEAQGFKLYAAAPLPFLRYFLRQEAAEVLLPSAAAVRGAVLAAAASGSAAGGAAGTAVLAAKAAASLAVRKGLAVAACLALAGTIGMAMLRPAPAEPEIPASPAVEETVPPPRETVSRPVPLETEPHFVSAPPEDPPPPEEPASPAERRTEVPPLPEETGPSRIVVVELNPYVPPKEPEGLPAEELRKKGKDREPVRNPRPSQDGGSGGEETEPRPEDPEPEPPAPERPGPEKPGPENPGPEDPDPENPEPEGPEQPVPPASGREYKPNKEFGKYRGVNEEGVHKFDVELYSDRELWCYPFLSSNYYSREVVVDPDRLGITNGHIYGIAPGKSEVRYYLSEKSGGPYELKCIANVTVRPETPITPNYDWGGYQKTSQDGVFCYSRTIRMSSPAYTAYDAPIAHGNFYMKMEVSDPAVVTTLASGQFYAAAPGTAEICYYTRWVPADPWQLTASVQLTVTSPDSPEPPPPEAIRKELRAGYGYSSEFGKEWGDALPETLVYASSKPSVAYIQETGNFSTLTPGDAVLTASDPGSPGVVYELAVHVEDAFSWKHGFGLERITLTEGEVVEQWLNYETGSLSERTGINWRVSDSSIVRVEEIHDTHCKVLGAFPGTAEVSVEVYFLVYTPDGSREMKGEASFTVCVEAAPPPEPGAIEEHRKPLPSYGYGMDENFRYFWGREPLPANLVYTTSDPAVVAITSDGFLTTLAAGSAELTAWDPEEPEVRYILEAEVEDCLYAWHPQFEDLEVELGETARPHSFTYGLSGTITKVEMISSAPEIIEVSLPNLYGNFIVTPRWPGTAEVTAVVSVRKDTHQGSLVMQDTVSCRITVKAPEDASIIEVSDFGYCSGYGYAGSLPALFAEKGENIPEEGMEYRTSDWWIAEIGEDGVFRTKKPGKVVLTASPEGESGRTYMAVLEVQDRFDWKYTIEDLVLQPGESAVHGLSSYELNGDTSITFSSWQAEDALMLSVARRPEDNTACSVTSRSVPGVTEVTGKLSFFNKISGMYYADVTFKVKVPWEEETPETPPAQEPEDFGAESLESGEAGPSGGDAGEETS